MKNALLGKSNKRPLQKSGSNSQWKSGRGKTTEVRWWHLLQWERLSCLGMFPGSHLQEFQSLPDQGWIDRDHLLAHYCVFSLLNTEPTNRLWHPEVSQLWAVQGLSCLILIPLSGWTGLELQAAHHITSLCLVIAAICMFSATFFISPHIIIPFAILGTTVQYLYLWCAVYLPTEPQAHQCP